MDQLLENEVNSRVLLWAYKDICTVFISCATIKQPPSHRPFRYWGGVGWGRMLLCDII